MERVTRFHRANTRFVQLIKLTFLLAVSMVPAQSSAAYWSISATAARFCAIIDLKPTDP